MCPVCIHAHPQIPKSKGARCPIHDSGEFRDCMQIDLIDYCANEQRNVYGQVANAMDYGCEGSLHWLMLLFKSYSKQKCKVCLL